MPYKTVACILFILSVSSFVPAAPVEVREAREACADAVEVGEKVIILSGKRAALARGNPYERMDSDSDSSDTGWWTPQSLSPSALDDVSDTGVDTPSSSSVILKPSKLLSTPDGTEELLDPDASKSGATLDYPGGDDADVHTPSSSLGILKSILSKVWYTPDVNEEPLGPDASKPGTTPDYPSGSDSGVDTPSSSLGTLRSMLSKVWSTKGETEVPLDPETTTKNQPASSSKKKTVSWTNTDEVYYFEPDLPDPSELEEYLARVAAQQSSKGFAKKVKSFFGKLRKPNFRPRFQRTDDTRA
jgi:hypothetical protein